MSHLDKYLSKITAEDMQQMRIKAKETKEAKKLWAEEHLIQDFGDDEVHWRTLASKAGIRMPAKYVPSSDVKYMKRALKKLNIEPKEWLEVEGYKTLKGFSDDNPTWPMYSWIGLLLEHIDEIKPNELDRVDVDDTLDTASNIT